MTFSFDIGILITQGKSVKETLSRNFNKICVQMILWQILVNSTYSSGRLVGLDCYCNTKIIVQTCEQLTEKNSPENKDTERKMS